MVLVLECFFSDVGQVKKTRLTAHPEENLMSVQGRLDVNGKDFIAGTNFIPEQGLASSGRRYSSPSTQKITPDKIYLEFKSVLELKFVKRLFLLIFELVTLHFENQLSIENCV